MGKPSKRGGSTPGKISLAKVDAHMSADSAVQQGHTIHEWAGNHFADRLAARAAADSSLLPGEIASYKNDLDRIKNMQARALLAHSLALEAAPDKEKGERKAPETRARQAH